MLQSFDFVNPFLVHVFFASNDIIAKNPDALKRYLKGWFETVAYAKAHKADAIRITRETTRLPADEAEKVYDVIMPTMADDGHFDRKAVQVVKQSMIDMGQLQTMPDDKDLLTEAFLN